MAKRCAVIFGAIGYLLVLWRYCWAFAPVSSEQERQFLSLSCPVCLNVTAFRPGMVNVALLLFGPANALLFAIAAYFLARGIIRVRGPAARA